MNIGRKIVVALAMMAGLAMACVPPWKYTGNYSLGSDAGTSTTSAHYERPAEYGPLWNPPRPLKNPVLAHSEQLSGLGMGVEVDTVRLATQYVALLLVMAAFWLIFGQTAENAKFTQSPSHSGPPTVQETTNDTIISTGECCGVLNSQRRRWWQYAPLLPSGNPSVSWWRYRSLAPIGCQIEPLSCWLLVLSALFLSVEYAILQSQNSTVPIWSRETSYVVASLGGYFVGVLISVWVVATSLAVIAWKYARRSQGATNAGFWIGILLASYLGYRGAVADAAWQSEGLTANQRQFDTFVRQYAVSAKDVMPQGANAGGLQASPALVSSNTTRFQALWQQVGAPPPFAASTGATPYQKFLQQQQQSVPDDPLADERNSYVSRHLEPWLKRRQRLPSELMDEQERWEKDFYRNRFALQRATSAEVFAKAFVLQVTKNGQSPTGSQVANALENELRRLGYSPQSAATPSLRRWMEALPPLIFASDGSLLNGKKVDAFGRLVGLPDDGPD